VFVEIPLCSGQACRYHQGLISVAGTTSDTSSLVTFMDASLLQHWDLWVILLMLATVVPWRGYQRIKKLIALEVISSADRMAIYGSTILFQWLLAGLAFWRARTHDIPVRRLGVSLPMSAAVGIALAVALTLVLVVVQAKTMSALARLPVERQGRMGLFLRKLMPQSSSERVLFAGVALTAGICEEFLFRGFAITALMLVVEWGSGAALASALVASAIFATSHLYQGLAGVLSSFVIGFVFSYVYLATGSLLPTVLTHAVVDFVAGLRTQRVLARSV
jgi:membrane protease YdiL (CAAX protease family)